MEHLDNGDELVSKRGKNRIKFLSSGGRRPNLGRSDMLAMNVRLLARHPSLLLSAPRGKPEVIKAHAVLEIQKARKLFQTFQTRDLLDLFDKFDKALCPNYKGCFLYAIARKIRPSTVVETGVASGVSSLSILQALQDNYQGSLYSIDLPNQPTVLNIPSVLSLPRGQETGFLVPKSLRQRWTLVIGDSKQQLPKLLRELGTIDFFIHDSLHEYDHMMFEFNEAWPRLRSGGILFGDDIFWNPAFQDFCKMNGVQGNVVERNEAGHRAKMGWVEKP